FTDFTELVTLMILPARCSAVLLVSVGVLISSFNGIAQSDLPANIDNGLRQLLTAGQEKTTNAANRAGARPTRSQHAAVRDSEQRVLVEIHLNGSVALAEVRAHLNQLGANVTSESASYRQGAFTA